jgi:uncharacterized 2Fe-2S/4Fe-4S cluster protein (DUF4445 family)
VSDLVPVTFAPTGPVVEVEAGSLLIDAARMAGVVLAAPCGGRGTCGGCAVHVIGGELGAADEVEAAVLLRSPDGVRLACRARVVGPVSVEPVFGRPVEAEALLSGTDGHPTDPSARARVVAGIDFGTTTVAALLVEERGGKPIARAAAANEQSAFGADVLSRISAAMEGHGDELRRVGEASVASALERAATAAGIRPGGVDRLVIAANTAMGALLAGADVSGLAAHPFTTPAMPATTGAASDLSKWLAPGCSVVFVPPMAGFVGGDALAAMIAGGLSDPVEPQLLVDIGTNAEIVLATPSRVVIASAAAGPAFEGAGISSGGPAAPEAVERVVFEDDALRLRTIGDAAPRWLSGAGFVSAVAMLRRLGHVNSDGLLVGQGPLESRFARDSEGVAQFVLSDAGAPTIRVTQLDVRSLQLAKAAVRVGIEIVLARAGVSANEVSSVAIAGAFGAALDPLDLRALGVIPPSLAHRARRIGNAALEGAAAMALDPDLLVLAADVAHKAEHVDLASDPEFMAGFMSAMALSEGE